jgi:hypothetical protein
MCQSATDSLHFADVGPQALEVDFLGGRLTSDGGLAWLAEADAALGVSKPASRHESRAWRQPKAGSPCDIFAGNEDDAAL